MAKLVRRRGKGRIWLVALLPALFFFAVFAPVNTQAAAPPLFTQFCEGKQNDGGPGGHCAVPRGIAVDPSTGDIYVAEETNARIQKFTAWGGFLRAWGWDVIASGPGDDAVPPEDEFEVCVPADGDVCKKGVVGTGTGQFRFAHGIAVDSAGDLYVIDWANHRVQKFDADGDFLLMFGGHVNRTKEEVGAPEGEQNLCPVDPGDVCQAGTPGASNGEFDDKFNFLQGGGSNYITITSDDKVYVGDVDRIQRFNVDGIYQSQIAVPGGFVRALASDPSGNLYAATCTGANCGAGPFQKSNPEVKKLGPTGEELATIAVDDPRYLATDSASNLYVADFIHTPSSNGIERTIRKFAPTGAQVESFAGDFIDVFGLATSSACGIPDTQLLLSLSTGIPSDPTYSLRIHGSPPDPDICPPPSVPPSIEDSYAVSVGTDGATVRAGINPQFWADTTYHVQYGTAACIEGGWEAACVEEQPSAPGLALTDQVTNAALATKGIFLGTSEALLPDTEYRYRFVAQSSGGGPVRGVGGAVGADGEDRSFHTFPLPTKPKEDCPNQAFRTGFSASLPDCRAYEMVSPVEKNGSDIAFPSDVIDQASPGGEALTFATSGTAAFGEPGGSPGFHQYMAERDPAAGWSTHSIAAPRSSVSLLFGGGLLTPFKLFSEDLCNGWLVQDTDVPLVAGAPRGVPNLYRHQGLRQGCGEEGYELLTTVFPPGYQPEIEQANGPAGLYRPRIQGFSEDGGVSAIRAAARLTEDASVQMTEDASSGIYQLYAHQGGELRLVSVLPNGKANNTHSTVGTIQTVVEAAHYRTTSAHHAVARDGSRVYWTASEDIQPIEGFAGIGPGRLYLRLNPTQKQSKLNGSKKCTEAAMACTLPVSDVAEVLSGTKGSRFLDATADGSVAIFSTGEDLYEYDLAKALAAEAATSLVAHGVRGIMGASEDASRVYLASEEVCSGENKNSSGEVAEAGEPNLYLYERGDKCEAGDFTFIATLRLDEGGEGAIYADEPSKRISRVSPNGLHAAFASADPALARSVADYDNADAASGRFDREVYLFDATANGGDGRLVCASCNPTGARPAGKLVEKLNAEPKTHTWAAARIPGWTTYLHPGNVLSDDGRRLFFESFEALVPRDTNGKQDVYQWEAAGSKADCLEAIGGELFSPSSGGCLALISSGQDSIDAHFVDASTDGRDVFFLTGSSLLPQDIAFRDVYDARVLGGFAPPPKPHPACEGEACQSAPAPPDDPTPASSTFEGAGNVTEDRRVGCRKGRVRRKGRCVARKRPRGTTRTGKRRAGADRRLAR